MERLAGRVILLWGWQRRLVALLAGAVATMALAPFDFPAAAFIAFPLLVWLLDGAVGNGGPLRRLWPAFATGWWFGFGYFLAGMWWVGMDFLGGDGAAWALPLAVLGLPALLALFYGFAALVARLMWSDGFGRIAALAFGFGLAEWLRALLLSGFAWNAVGYAAMPVPLLMQIAQLIGVFGVSSLAVFVFSAPALLGTRRQMGAGLALAALLAALTFGYGTWRLATAAEAESFLHVRVVQPGAAGAQGTEERLEDYLSLSRAPGAEPAPQLILWPRMAIPFAPAERPELLEALGQALGEGQVLLAGALREEGEAGGRHFYDAVVAIDAEGAIADAADRVHLLPLVDRPPFARLLGREGYAAGATRRLLTVSATVKALPLIGNEAIVPSLAARRQGGAALIVNPAGHASHVSTLAPYQHLRQAQVRAVEAGLPLLAAMSNGTSAAIDSHGRIIDALAAGARGTLDVRLPLLRPEAGDSELIHLRGLTFVAFFGMLALLLSIRGRSN